jgi:cyclase
VIRKRLIPVLQLDQHKRLVKTVLFGERTYVGDPFNVIRLFNEKEVDEVCVLDIDASRMGRGPDFEFIKKLASECFMPLSYGGGITKLSDCDLLNRSGVEKFVLGEKAMDQVLVAEIASKFGAQALNACVDVHKEGAHYGCYYRSGTVAMNRNPLDFCQDLQQWGVGEIILQAMHCDGLRTGFDLHLVTQIAKALTIPVVALGGAGNIEHLASAIQSGADAVASGSAFTFVGRLRAVLINYPTQETILQISNATS